MEKINNFYEFIQWCFRSGDSGAVTLIVLGMLISGIIGMIKATRKK